MITEDSLVRRIRFVGDDFFKFVKIRDGTRARHYEIKDRIELPRSHSAPYFPEGRNIDFSVRDKTPDRVGKRKFDLAFEGKLFYRNDSEEIITVTIGNREDGFERGRIKKNGRCLQRPLWNIYTYLKSSCV